jgi:hypothetical protein
MITGGGAEGVSRTNEPLKNGPVQHEPVVTNEAVKQAV